MNSLTYQLQPCSNQLGLFQRTANAIISFVFMANPFLSGTGAIQRNRRWFSKRHFPQVGLLHLVQSRESKTDSIKYCQVDEVVFVPDELGLQSTITTLTLRREHGVFSRRPLAG
jgi:hypothetical protein